MKKFTFLVALVCFIIGCATPYQSYGVRGGYKDKKISDKEFEVYFVGNGVTSEEDVAEYWHTRAKELCPSGYEYKYTNSASEDGNSELWLPAGSVMVPIFISYPELDGVIKCSG